MGGRFCSLDQLYKKFSGNDVFSTPKLNEDQKQEKCLRRKLKSFFPEIRWRPKKRSSPQFATIFNRKFVGSLSPCWLFFLWSSSAQLSMEGRLNLDGGTLNLDGGTLTLDGGRVFPRSPYNLSTGLPEWEPLSAVLFTTFSSSTVNFKSE